MDDTPYVITRPDPGSGLGANLLSMVAALYVCERTGRSLIVDWTSMAALRDTETNYFLAFFEPMRAWRAVNIYYVNDTANPARSRRYDAAHALRPAGSDYKHILDGRFDDRAILLEPFHYHRVFKNSPLTPAALFHYTREFYQQLTPRPHLRDRLAALRARFEQGLVVGLHVRSGNGEFAKGGPYENRVKTAIFDHGTFIERIHRACRDCVAGFPAALRSDLAVFVATDSSQMQERLLRIPGAFAVRQRFPPPGTGHQFSDFQPDEYGGYSDVDAANDTIIDMFLLAGCVGLVCQESAYNQYAQHMTKFFNGNLKALERYFDPPLKRLGRMAFQFMRRP